MSEPVAIVSTGDLRRAFDRWAEGTRHMHSNFVPDAGKYVGQVPAEEHRVAEAALLDGVPALFAEIEALREVVRLTVKAPCPCCGDPDNGSSVPQGHPEDRGSDASQS